MKLLLNLLAVAAFTLPANIVFADHQPGHSRDHDGHADCCDQKDCCKDCKGKDGKKMAKDCCENCKDEKCKKNCESGKCKKGHCDLKKPKDKKTETKPQGET